MENQPLAERLRPKNLDEYIGQQHFNNLIELAKDVLVSSLLVLSLCLSLALNVDTIVYL